MSLPESAEGSPSQGLGAGKIVRITNFLENYIGTDDWRCHYIRGRWPFIYIGCPRRNVQYLRRVFLMLNYTDITQNTYIRS